MPDIDLTLRRHETMKQRRSNFDGLWQEVAEMLLPRQADFLSSPYRMTQGQRRTSRIFDETAMLALDHGISVFEGEVIPRGGIWQNLLPRDEKLMTNDRVRLWYEELTARLFALRTSPYSGFANQTHESIASLLSFGNQGMWTDLLRDARGLPIGLSYRSEHIGEVYVDEDFRGVVDTVHREFHLTHRQAVQRWGDKAPEAAKKGMRDKRPDDSACYLHVLEPNRDYDPGRLDAKGKKIASCYIETGEKEIFDEGGYRSMPLIYSRYEKSPTETYGRGPAMNVLPAVKAAQAVQRDVVTATEFMAKPALLAHDDMMDQLLSFSPGGITYGALDERGNPLIRPTMEGADITPALQLQERTRQIIERAFFVDLYTIRQEIKTHVTATEIMQREREKGIMLAPLSRQETEWFTPMADRELDLMNELGMLNDMPPEVKEAGGLFQIVYENPIARARKAEMAGGFYQMLSALTPLLQADPANYREFATEFPFRKVLHGLSEIHAVPVSWRATEDEQKAADAAKDAQTKTATMLDVGQRASEIAKNMGVAEASRAAA